MSDPRVMGVLVDSMRKLAADDPRNLDFDKAAALLKLGEAQKRQLKAAGATSLAGIATVLHAAPEVEAQNADVQRLRTLYKTRKVERPLPDLLKLGVSAKDSGAIVAAIGDALASHPATGLPR